MKLDLKPFMCEPPVTLAEARACAAGEVSSHSSREGEKSTIYHLYGVCVHSGGRVWRSLLVVPLCLTSPAPRVQAWVVAIMLPTYERPLASGSTSAIGMSGRWAHARFLALKPIFCSMNANNHSARRAIPILVCGSLAP